LLQVDTEKLTGIIYGKKFSKSSFAKEIGLDRKTLSVYMNDPNRFTVKMINLMAQILVLNDEEFKGIFFYH
jgi:hypothetical protein